MVPFNMACKIRCGNVKQYICNSLTVLSNLTKLATSIFLSIFYKPYDFQAMKKCDCAISLSIIFLKNHVMHGVCDENKIKKQLPEQKILIEGMSL